MATLTYGTVTGRFEDTVPGATEPITGTVYFTPEADYLLSADSTVIPAPVAAELVDAAFSVDLAATDNPALNPVDWTYRVTFSLKVNGQNIKRAPFSISVPAGEVTDLASVTPVASSEGSPMLRGEDGTDGVDGVPGIRGSRWFRSDQTNPDFADVVGPVAGDIFLYQSSKDYFMFNGSGWDYVGNLAA